MSLSNKVKVLLLSCGSFNPVTIQHLKLFDIAKDFLSQKQYDVVKGIISPVHDAYGKKGLIPSMHRVAMARLATSSSKLVRVDDWESLQPGWSRTLDVLKHAKECVAKSVAPYTCDNGEDATSVQVKLLCGGDLLESFAVPGLWEDQDISDIVGSFGIVVICRPGSNPERFVNGTEVLSRNRENIHIIEPQVLSDVSATEIRERLRTGQSVKHLTLDSVIDYISSHGLYASS